MGLVSELHDIRVEMTYKERQRIERENKKAIEEQYKKAIKNILESTFYNLFRKHDFETANKKAIFEKQEIIKDLTKELEAETYKKDGKEFYTYQGKFYIDEDLQDNYNAILNRIKKDFETLHKETEKELTEKLRNEIERYFMKYEEKWAIYETLQEKRCVNFIISELAENEEERKTLESIYFKTFHEVAKFYKIEIETQRRELKEQKREARERAKVKRRDKLLFLYLINKIL